MTRQELKNTLEQVDCILDLQEELTHYDGIDTDLFLARAYQLGLETGLEAEEGVKGTLTQDYLSPSELMIGDWVVYHGDVDYEYPHKITGLATEDISVGDDGFLGGWKEMVSPIPLTEDILKANGFVRHGGIWQLPEDFVLDLGGDCGLVLSKDFSAIALLQDNDRQSAPFVWGDCVGNEFVSFIGVIYCHELQHLFRSWCYEELADNFKLS